MTSCEKLVPVFFLSCVFALSGCGGGGHHDTTPTPTPDFSISASPSSASVLQGGTAGPFSVSVSALNGFSGAVSVAIEGLPQGVTSTPAFPFSVTAGASQQVTLSVPASVPAANSTISFHGTSGTLSHSAAASLAVTGFSISVSPNTSQTSPLGIKVATAGGSITVGAVGQNGFSGTVDFSLSGIPAGVSVSPTTWSLAAGKSQVVTFTATTAATSGAAQVQILAVSGTLSNPATLFLRIDSSLSATIGPEGGTLAVTDPNDPLYGLELSIPANALSQAANIQINPLTDIQMSATESPVLAMMGIGVELHPEGLQFDIPATLRLPYPDTNRDGMVDGIADADARLLHSHVFDPSLGTWLFLPSSVDLSHAVVSTSISSFSTYRWWYWKWLHGGALKYAFANPPSRCDCSTTSVSQQCSDSSVYDSVTRAIYTWARHMKLAEITFRGAISGEWAEVSFDWRSFSGDPRMIDICKKLGISPSACAATQGVSLESLGRLVPEYSVYFNDDLLWTTDNSRTVDPPAWNTQAITTHEMGHVLMGPDHFAWPQNCEVQVGGDAGCVTNMQPPVMTAGGFEGRPFFDLFTTDLVPLYNLYDLSRNTEMAYVTNQGADSVSVIRLADNAVISKIPLGSGSVNGPQGITKVDDRGKAYVAVYDAGTIYTVDLSTNKVWPMLPPTQIGAGNNEIAVTADGTWAFVANSVANTVSEIDLADTRTTHRTFQIPQADGVAVAPDGKQLIVSSLTGNLSTIDLSSGSQSSIPVGQKLEAVAIEPNGRYALAVDPASDQVLVIDICPARLQGDCQGTPVSKPIKIAVGRNPLAITLLVDSSRHKAYVSNFFDGSITVIDLASCLGLIQTSCTTHDIHGFTNPVGSALTPDGNLLYVADFGTNEVRIVDTNLDTLRDKPRIQVGTNPVGITITSRPMPASFDFALDSLQVQGNISQSFVDGFDDDSLTSSLTSRLVFEQGLTGADQSGGYLNFRSRDGAHIREHFVVDSLIVTPALNKGAGDSVVVAVFRPDVPAIGQFYCLGIAGGDPAQVCVTASSSGTVVILGTPVNPIESHPVSLSAAETVVMRLRISDLQGKVTASYSADGGQTFTDFQTARSIFTQETSSFVFVQAAATLPFIGSRQQVGTSLSRGAALRSVGTTELGSPQMPSPPSPR